MTVDPTLRLTLHAALSLLLASAAWHKLRDVEAFRVAVAEYRLLPTIWVVPFAAALVAAEVGMAFALWLPGVSSAAALGCAALLALYATAMAVTLRRGRRDVDCGCSGPAHRQSVRPALVVRNAILVAGALLGALPSSGRPLAWMDTLTVAMATAVLACLYGAIDGILAQGPRLAALARLRRPEVAGA